VKFYIRYVKRGRLCLPAEGLETRC